MSDTASRFLDFIHHSPSSFHAVENLCAQLIAAGFHPLYENETWELVPGSSYFVSRNHSALIAFSIPRTGFAPYQIVASHSDSPCFKMKPIYEEIVLGGHYIRMNMEKYGGMIMSTWFDRPLSVAGRVIVRENNGITEKLINIDRDCLLIPNLPIHFNRDVNTNYSLNAQTDMAPIYGAGNEKGKLAKEIANQAGVSTDDIIASDLYLYSRVPGTVWGADSEFVSCSRIDDLECAWTSLQAFINTAPKSNINVCCIFDNEEVGSGSRQGAGGDFMINILRRIGTVLGAAPEKVTAAINSSFMVSADNAHAVHPNHPEKFDAVNRTYMNEGVVIKQNASQKYTTDAISSAVFSEICKKAGVPVQYFANRSDLAGGSTLGNIANSHASMNTVDIGLPQLAMHSSYETAGVRDIDYMIDALKMFYSVCINIRSDGGISIC